MTYSFRIRRAVKKRVGAKLVPEILANITSPDQYELLEMSRMSGFVDRARGTGRPTKKERRAIDQFHTPPFYDSDIDDASGSDLEEE